MADDIVQIIENARVDATSLSEFIYYPANAMVQRRLAPSIHTLNYYLDYLHGLELIYSQPTGTVTVNGEEVKTIRQAINDSVDSVVLGEYQTQLEQRVGTNEVSISNLNDSVSDIETSLLDSPVVDGKVPANKVSVATGVTQEDKNLEFRIDIDAQKLDTGITATAKFGGVERTLSEKLSDSVSIKDFILPSDSKHTDAFKRAKDYLVSNGGGVLNLADGETYTIDDKIIIPTSNVKITGLNSKVVWDGTVGGGLYDAAFEFTGTPTTTTTTVAVSAPIDSSFIKVNSVSGFSVNDYVQFTSSTATVKPHRFILQLYRIVSIDPATKTVLLDAPIGVAFDISTYSITMTKVDTVDNCHTFFEFEAVGQTSREVGISAVQFTYASKCSSKIKAEGLWFKAVSHHYVNGCVCSVDVSKPAAVGGGEGYGMQFAFSTNCIGFNSRGYGLRHLADATASVNVTFQDMWDSGSKSAAYNLHSMTEWNIQMTNCHSIGSEQYGFGIGSYGSGVIGHWSGNVTLDKCTSMDSKSIAVKATTAQGNYTFNDCVFRTLDGNSSSYAVVVTNADVTINNCRILSGIYVLNDTIVKNDGFVRVTGGRIARNNSTKAVQMSAGTSLSISNCEVNNYWSLLGVCDLNITNNSVITTDGNHFVSSNIFTHNISISNSTIKLRGTTNSLYIVYGDEINLNNVKFDSTNNIGMRVYSNKTVISNCRGALRLVNDAANIVELKNNSLDLDATFTSAITLNNTKAAIDIDSNRIKFLGSNTIGINSSNTVAGLKYTNNTVDGNAAIPAVPTKGIFKDNTTAGTSTFPTASATVLVKDNI